jgi:uncharacterized NAD(P)/FAD-binding protein YdhS
MIHQDVTVVGSGFSAVATALNLMRHLEPGRALATIGRTDTLGLGVAYSTTDEVHRLNVPSGRMSLFPDEPSHLTDWLADCGHDYSEEDFIPRRLFGRYVRDTLDHALHRTDNRAAIALIDADAIDCEELSDDRQVFHLSNGQRLTSRASVFCLGGTPAGLPLPEGRIAPAARRHICLNVWADSWLDRVDPDQDIFMLGSGLTMIDQVMSLSARGFRGRVHVLSRHGLLPLPHRQPRSAPLAPAIEPGSGPLSHMMRRLRDAAKGAEDWRSAVDGIRPVTQALWQHLDDDQRRRFLRHANSWWNIHRHRLAPDIFARFQALRDAGRVTVTAGWLQEVYAQDGRARIAYRDRHLGTLRQLSADWVVNCTGMEKCSISKVPLLKKMSARGMISGDPLGLGLAVNEKSQILREDGSIVKSAFAMGPMTTGQFFEIFAVPDIRIQAQTVARRIAADLAGQ